MSEETEQAIKETAARDLRNKGQDSVPEAKAEAFTVVKYYGYYHNCYAVMLNEPYFDFPAVEVDKWGEVGEVAFHITSFYEIKIWKK